MKLADLRRVTIKTNARIRFPLSNGMECVLNEQGIAQIPAQRAALGLNLEEELARAAQFTLEPAASPDKIKSRPQILNREQLAALIGSKSAAAHADEHEE